MAHRALVLLLVPAAGLAACGGRRAEPPRRSPAPTTYRGHLLSAPLTRRVSRIVTATCRADVRSTPVPCPALVPDVPMIRDPNLHGSIAPRHDGGYYLLSFNNGQNGRALHFIVGIGSPAFLWRNAFDDTYNEVKGKPRRLADMTVDGIHVRTFQFFGGPNLGHYGALADRPDGLQAFASMHGRRYLDVAVLMAVDLAHQPTRR